MSNLEITPTIANLIVSIAILIVSIAPALRKMVFKLMSYSSRKSLIKKLCTESLTVSEGGGLMIELHSKYDKEILHDLERRGLIKLNETWSGSIEIAFTPNFYNFYFKQKYLLQGNK